MLFSVLTKWAGRGAAGWRLSSTQEFLALASSFLFSFSLMRCRKLSLLFECFTCSMRTLIHLARILPLTCLLTMMPTACCVTL